MASTETVWIAPQVEDLAKVLGYELQQVSNENVQDPSNDLQNLINMPFDPDKPDRRAAQLQLCQQEFYYAVLTGNRVPVSSDTTTIPPECVRPCLQLAAYNLLASMLNLKSVIVTENGVYTPFNKLQQESQQWLARLRGGFNCTLPSSPVTPAAAGAADGGSSGDIVGNYDMTFDGNVTPTPLRTQP